jgi:hypothetical protein
MVLAADVVWVEELVEPLLNALSWLTNEPAPGGGRPLVLMAHQTRSRASDALLYGGLQDRGFVVHTVSRALHHARFSDQAIDILEISRP